MIHEGFPNFSSEIENKNNIINFPSKEVKRLEPLDEAKEMHGRSIEILADYLKISYQEADEKLISYITTKQGFDKKDEMLSRIINTASKTYATLQAKLNQDSGKSFTQAA